jgi:hypothetical protein
LWSVLWISDTKADLDNFTFEKYHQQTCDHMWQKMKNASVTQPISLTIDSHPALQNELTGTERAPTLFSFTPPADDGDYF